MSARCLKGQRSPGACTLRPASSSRLILIEDRLLLLAEAHFAGLEIEGGLADDGEQGAPGVPPPGQRGHVDRGEGDDLHDGGR
jgi:hypothetical protein